MVNEDKFGRYVSGSGASQRKTVTVSFYKQCHLRETANWPFVKSEKRRET